MLMLMVFVDPNPLARFGPTSGNHKTGWAVGFVIHFSWVSCELVFLCVPLGFLAYGTWTIFACDFLKCWVCVMLGGHFWGDISAGLRLRHLATTCISISVLVFRENESVNFLYNSYNERIFPGSWQRIKS